MLLKTKFVSLVRLVLWTASSLSGQSLPGQSVLAQTSAAQPWNLPHGTAVKDNGPRPYRFSVDYNTANTKGEVVYRQRLTGEYTGCGSSTWFA